MRWLYYLAGAVFVLSIVTFIISSNVRWAANSPLMYSFLFDVNDVEATSGIPKDQLMRGADQSIHYFNSTIEPLQVVIQVDGRDRQVYGQREILHMGDVKGLFRGTYRVQEASAAYLGAFILGSAYFRRRRAVRPVAKLVLAGGGAAIGLVALLGLSSTVLSFDPIFNAFHEISFSNDFWRLPAESYLVRMYPDGFWLGATLLIGAASIVEGLFLMTIAGTVLRRTRQPHPLKHETPQYTRGAA